MDVKRHWIGLIVAGLLLWPASALAEETPDNNDKPEFSVTLNIGGGATYSDDTGVGDFSSEEINGEIAFTAKFGPVFVQLAHADVHNNDSGDDELDTLAVGYRDTCFGSEDLSCVGRVKFADGASSSVTYRLGITHSHEYPVQSRLISKLAPALSLTADAVTGDRSESVVTVGFELPMTLGEDNPDAWTVTPAIGVGYGFESEQSEPSWGLSLGRDFGQLGFSIGYEGQTSLDENGDYGDVDHSAFVELSWTF